MKFGLWLALIAAVAPGAARAACEEREVLVAEMRPNARGGYVLSLNGKDVSGKDAATAYAAQCARKLVALVHPDITFRQVSDLGALSGKVGVRLGRDNFFVFYYMREKTVMVYFPALITVKFSNDPKVLADLIANPRTRDSGI